MLNELKPYLTSLALPPTSLLVLILIGTLLIGSKPKFAKRIIFFLLLPFGYSQPMRSQYGFIIRLSLSTHW
jgi:hypothetical protein